MDPEEFNQYRSETLWPKVVEHLNAADTSGASDGADDQGIETVPDYLQEVVGDVPSESWCEDHSEALHIFTRYYPYKEQDVTLLLSNPRLDFDDDTEEDESSSEDDFPTLEHRRYAVTEPDDIEKLASVSAEHYNSYLNEMKGRQCLIKRLGTVTNNLKISGVVEELLDTDQWDGDRGTENSGVDSNDDNEEWNEYFYNPEETQNMSIANMEDMASPRPKEWSETPIYKKYNKSSDKTVLGEDCGLSAQSPNLETGLYNDFYITNLYKLGTPNYDDTPTNEEDHVEMTTQEIKKVGSELVIAMGVPAQQVLIELGGPEPVFDPSSKGNGTMNDQEYSNPCEDTRTNYGVVWQLNSEQYGLAVPHPSRFNSELGQAFEENSDEGWKLLSDALKYIGSETGL